jgi:hypothetical protein
MLLAGNCVPCAGTDRNYRVNAPPFETRSIWSEYLGVQLADPGDSLLVGDLRLSFMGVRLGAHIPKGLNLLVPMGGGH